MPNWIEGTVKVRGKYKDILNFFKTGITAYQKSGNHDATLPRDEWIHVEEKEDPKYGKWCTIELLHDEWAHVNDTRRAFIFDNGTIVNEIESDNDEKQIVMAKVAQAWSFDVEDWMAISEKYHIDFRLYGLESGMQFGQEIEIVDGKLMRNISFGYDDWDWECPFPWMGG